MGKVSIGIGRSILGYWLTLVALTMLWAGFVTGAMSSTQTVEKKLLSLAIVLAPLALFSYRAIKRDRRAYQILALLSPVYFFIGGIIYLWASGQWGGWIMIASCALEIGTILHNFKKQRK